MSFEGWHLYFSESPSMLDFGLDFAQECHICDVWEVEGFGGFVLQR